MLSHWWCLLLARIYENFPLQCPRCSNPLRLIACITRPAVIEHILTHIGEPAVPPPVLPARAPPQQELEFDQTAGLPTDGYEFDQSRHDNAQDLDQTRDWAEDADCS